MQSKLYGLDYRISRSVDALANLISYIENNKNKLDPVKTEYLLRVLYEALDLLYKGM